MGNVGCLWLVSVLAAGHVKLGRRAAHGFELDGVVNEVRRDMPTARFDALKRERRQRIYAEPPVHQVVKQSIRYQNTTSAGRSLFQDHVQRVNDPGNVPKERQQDINPEMGPESHLQKDADRWQQDREKNFDGIGGGDGHVPKCHPLRPVCQRSKRLKGFVDRTTAPAASRSCA